MRELEAENAKLKRMYADLALENTAIKDRSLPKMVTPSARRQAVSVLAEEHRQPVKKAREATGLSRAAYYRKPHDCLERDREVIEALNERRAAQPLGLLEVLPAPASGWQTLESQAAMARVL